MEKEYEKTGLLKQYSEWISLFLSVSTEIYGIIEKTSNNDMETYSITGTIAIIVGILSLGYFLFSMYQRLRVTEKFLLKSYEAIKKTHEKVLENEINTLSISYSTAYTLFCHTNNLEEDNQSRKEFVKTKIMNLSKDLTGTKVNTELERYFASEKV